MYKLINGYPEPAPSEFIEDGRRIVGFTDDFLRERGYKPVMWSEPTNENQVDTYTETETEIIQEWITPESDPLDPMMGVMNKTNSGLITE